MIDVRTILFDFDGVLCHDRFYVQTLLPEYVHVYEWIQTNIFGMPHEDWLRGIVSSERINKIISDGTGIEFDLLHEKFLESVRMMKLDERVKDLVRELKSSGHKVGLVTDNMDVFSDITIKNHKLDEVFEVILNSADYRILKKDNHGELFDIALEKLNAPIENTLMIDNSRAVIDLYIEKGGEGFLYEEFEGLQNFLLEK